MEKNELLPCPFCGSAGYVTKNPFTGHYSVKCRVCGATMTGEMVSSGKAIEEWNRRDNHGSNKEKCGQANKMEQVAAMFGKKLNEEFTIKYEGKCYKAYFKKSGIRVRGLYYMDWNDVLVGLLTGESTIVG